MTFEQLNNKLGNNLVEANWHQAKGGGWIEKTAYVEHEENIRDNAIIRHCVRVFDRAWVYENAMVSGNTDVYGTARVSGSAWVSCDSLSGSARVSGLAYVTGGHWTTSPLYIQGSTYPLTNNEPGYIKIGCKKADFEWGLRNGEAYARSIGFTDEQIKEYRGYVELICKQGRKV